MRAIGLLVFALACGKGSSSCPTVDELVRGSSPERKELEIVVAQCRAHHWSTAVTKCLRDAPTDEAMEKCFKQLSAAQQKSLRAAFEPIGDELDAEVEAEKRAHDEAFQLDLAKRGIASFATRAKACTDYLEAIDTASKQTTRCSTKGSLLEIYGFQQLVMKQVDELAAITDDAQLGETCTRHAGTLRDDAKRLCDSRDRK